MVVIENINYEQFFPSVDFIVRNRQKSTLILWQFAVQTKRSVVDPKPSLNFSLTLGKPDLMQRNNPMGATSLNVEVQNNGWGVAKSAEFRLEDPVLQRIFGDETLRYTGTVESGERKTILRLPANATEHGLFLQVYKEAMKRARHELQDQFTDFLNVNEHLTPRHGYPDGYLDWSFRKFKNERIEEFKQRWYQNPEHSQIDGFTTTGTPTIPIVSPSMQWRCVDEWGVPVNGRNTLLASRQDGALYLCPEGFLQKESHVRFADRDTEVQYCIIIDPHQAVEEKTFPVSHRIEAGKDQRFSIMIGASQSCLMETVFSFSLDDDASIESEPFQINVWNPMNSQWDRKYRDGDRMRQYALELETRARVEGLRESDQSLVKELRWLEDKLESYPFQRSA